MNFYRHAYRNITDITTLRQIYNMGSEVVTDEQAFAEDHVPKKILHRDKQVKHVKGAVKPVKENKVPESLFLFGPPGTGKTASVRWLLDNHHKDTGVYVNCWNCRTGYEE